MGKEKCVYVKMQSTPAATRSRYNIFAKGWDRRLDLCK